MYSISKEVAVYLTTDCGITAWFGLEGTCEGHLVQALRCRWCFPSAHSGLFSSGADGKERIARGNIHTEKQQSCSCVGLWMCPRYDLSRRGATFCWANSAGKGRPAFGNNHPQRLRHQGLIQKCQWMGWLQGHDAAPLCGDAGGTRASCR